MQDIAWGLLVVFWGISCCLDTFWKNTFYNLRHSFPLFAMFLRITLPAALFPVNWFCFEINIVMQEEKPARRSRKNVTHPILVALRYFLHGCQEQLPEFFSSLDAVVSLFFADDLKKVMTNFDVCCRPIFGKSLR